MKRLQAIRIPAGWTIVYNNLYECDCDDSESGIYLIEDLYQIFNERLDVLIDVGWYGSAENGSFKIIQVRHDFQGVELAKFSSRRLQEIVLALESWLIME